MPNLGGKLCMLRMSSENLPGEVRRDNRGAERPHSVANERYAVDPCERPVPTFECQQRVGCRPTRTAAAQHHG